MPFLITKREFKQKSFQFLGGEIPTKQEFRLGLNLYISRILDHDIVAGVSLYQDDTVIYFTTSTIDAIIDSGSGYLVARFGCEDNIKDYSHLTISLCGMNLGDRTVKTKHYIGTKQIGEANQTYEDIDKLDEWIRKETSYIQRREILIKRFPNVFRKDFSNGLAHEMGELNAEWYKKAKDDGMTDVAVFYIIAQGHLSLAYVDARIDINSLRKDYVIYDFGGACCPPS